MKSAMKARPGSASKLFVNSAQRRCGTSGIYGNRDMRKFARGPFFASTTVKYIERAHSLHHYDSNDSGHFLDV